MYILDVLKSILFGIIEGITEWLPISSTGHMILLEKICKFKEVSPNFFEMYLVVIQLGAIIAVVVMFWNKLWPFKKKQLDNGKSKIAVKPRIIELWFKVIVGSIPAGIIGLLLDDILDKYLYNYITVAITLIVYGVLFIIVERLNRRRKPKVTKLTELSFKDSFLIGCFQALSLIPGTSRSGSTILGGIILGESRRVASEFTFFLAVPAMLGASVLKIAKFGFGFTVTEFVILFVGMITAFTVSLVAIRFLMNYIKKHTFTAFGIYRIILGAIVLATYFITK
ncbi:MAG: undecaprenyl-diphosphate phosphatase [Acutalibacteraceae bacterium]